MEGIVEEVDKFLTEAMGSPQVLPWENWAPDINFSTPASFFKLWNWAIEQDWWDLFTKESHDDAGNKTIIQELINPERFAKSIYEYLNDGGSPSRL